MAWGSDDQNPSLAPSQTSGVNYAAALNSAAYYNPLSGGSSSTGMAPGVSGQAGQPSYADRLNAANPEQKKQTTSQALAKSADRVITPWETRETWNRSKATSADRTQFARGYLTKNSPEPGGTMLRQGVGTSIDRLHPVFAQRLSLAVQQARKEGMQVGIRSAYRPPGFGVGGMRDKRQSLHAYGLSVDVSGIGRPGSDTAKRWAEIAQEHGLYNPWASNPKEWNHWQLVPNRVASELPGLRDTITARGPGDLNAMWAASGVDPGEMVNRPEMMAARIPTPRARPAPAGFDTGRLDAATAYAPPPQRTGAPFDAVMADVPTPRQRPQQSQPTPQARQAPSAAPSTGGYTVRRGDTLSAIAQRELGDPNRWREIAQANGIRNPRRLMPGQQLVIPASATRTVDIPQPRVRPRIASGPVGPTTRQGVLDMGPRSNPRRDPNGFMIDVNRPAITNADGSISTERTATFQVGRGFFNVPTLVNGREVSPDEAYAAFEAGQNPAVQGPFRSVEEAEAAAQQRSAAIPRARATADGARVPNPRMRPQPAMPQWNDVDAMTEVDEQGNYLAQPAPQPPPRAVRESAMPLRTDAQGDVILGPADVGREASEYRSRALAGGAQDGPGLDGLVEGFGQELRQSGRFRYPSGWSAADIGREVSDKRQMFIEAGVPPGPQLDKIVNDYERMLMQMIAPDARGQPAVAGLQGPPAYTAGNGVRIWIG